MRRRFLLAPCLALIAPAALAQETADEAVGEASDMQALEAAVPKQAWYPDGYYDVRIAAEAEVAETATTSVPKPGEKFNLVACRTPNTSLGTDDPLLNRYGAIALETARLRFELGRHHFPEARYGAPLIAFERDRIVGAVPKDQVYRALATALNGQSDAASSDLPIVIASDDCSPPSPSPPPAAADPGKPADSAQRDAEQQAIAKTEVDRYQQAQAQAQAQAEYAARSAAAYEAEKARASAYEAQARRAREMAEEYARRERARMASVPRPAAAAPSRARGVVFTTQPPAGEVLMINSFAFKVCTRKNPDPWDRFQCKWNEIETGVPKPLSGRFVYQVKWPDGTVRKGTREIAPADTGAVTFRKVGS